jgi:ribosomal protein L12E/L44/L45/RPP1/RPP2
MVDVRHYIKGKFLKVDDFAAEARRRESIQGTEEGKFDKLNLLLSSGDQLALSATNLRRLTQAYGFNSEDWVGLEIELYVGQLEFNGRPVDSILLKPISPGRTTPTAAPRSSPNSASPSPSSATVADDSEIPF